MPFSASVVTPDQMVEISSDNVSYYGRGNSNLPLVYYNVPAGGTQTVYVRTNVPRNLTGSEDRVAYLITEMAISI